jgi:hypothetical protein
MSFWDVCQEIPDNDELVGSNSKSGYNEETLAWPVLIDEYVEYIQEKYNNNSKKG